jgi:hypothetical protein
MARNYSQGIYKPINPQKYEGDVNNIVYRSSWEKRFFIWCDTNPSVVGWSSEETVIPYVCGTDKTWHRYFVDAKLKIKDLDGKIGTFLVEIKPYKETQKPEFKGRKTKQYLTECLTYVKNQSKWAYAKNYAQERGMKFIIITEKELGIK